MRVNFRIPQQLLHFNITDNKLHTLVYPSSVHKYAQTSDMLRSPSPVQNAIHTQFTIVFSHTCHLSNRNNLPNLSSSHKWKCF